jgi:putative transposase
VIERLFRTTDDEFTHLLVGNTVLTKTDVRSVTPPVDPVNKALWTLPALQIAVQAFVHGTYDKNLHGTLGQSPADAYNEGLARWGHAEWTRIDLTESLEILTMPAPAKETAKVVAGRGVKINYHYFWCDAFRSGKVEGKRVPVRYHPFDGHRAWARIEGKWIALTSLDAHLFAGLSERAIRLLTDRRKDDDRQASQRLEINASNVASFLERKDKAEALLSQIAADSDQCQVMQMIFGSNTVTGDVPRHYLAPQSTTTPAVGNSTPTDEMNLLQEDAAAGDDESTIDEDFVESADLV